MQSYHTSTTNQTPHGHNARRALHEISTQLLGMWPEAQGETGTPGDQSDCFVKPLLLKRRYTRPRSPNPATSNLQRSACTARPGQNSLCGP